MKKVFFLTALAALALSSCSSDETVQAPVQQDGAIAFDIYTSRAVSRNADLLAGDKQSITTERLKASTEGFGVYAYETGAQKFKSYLAGNTYPQYMFNQKVTWVSENPTAALTDLTGPYYTAGDWKYNPVKYWPNDDSYVTFQAYAPWKASTENVLFDVKYNGVAIRYNVYESYDLLWGENVADAQKCCFEDQRKPGIADKTKFHFNHALSKVDFSISYNADDMDCTTPDGKLDENTEIVIRSIKLLGTLPSQGVVSLYDGSWTVEKVSENLFEYDTDFFGYVNAVGNSNLTITGSTNNPQKVGDYIDGAQPGVLTHDVNRLYANESVMLIPAQTDAKLEISYDVVTKDANGFKGHTKNITIVSDNIPTYWGNTHQDATLPDTDPESGAGNGKGVFHFEAGKWTTINIHLGMTSVKLDADVQPWDKSESGSIDMPANSEGTNAPADDPADDPNATTGTAKATIGGSEVDVTWIQLWENAPKFAEYNVGVTDGKSESFGGYYEWGSSIDKDTNSVAYKEGSEDLTGNDDTATYLWGNNWRMPTYDELNALLTNCDAAWTDNYKESGVKGIVFTGKEAPYSSNSIFFPAAGYSMHNNDGNVSYENSMGSYWTSNPDDTKAWRLYFMGGTLMMYNASRYWGYSVRAVLVENENYD